MFINRQREKLLNAMKYFIANTRHCHTLKLFKLLNFLDFEHYRQTGRSVTGLTYRALPKGPVPTDLLKELQNGPQGDLAGSVDISYVKDENDAVLRRDLKAKAAFDAKHFTKRELRIMERLVEYFRDTNAEDMSQVSHARRLPWGKVYQGGKGTGQIIPYDLAIDSEPMMADVIALNADEISARKELFAEIDGRH